MKGNSVIKSLLIGGSILTSSLGISEAFATMTLAARCKENFIGRVHSVTDLQTPLSSLAKVTVEFTVQDRDDSNTEKDSLVRSITVLRDGPNKFEEGQVYDVGLNQGFVCRMQRLES